MARQETQHVGFRDQPDRGIVGLALDHLLGDGQSGRGEYAVERPAGSVRREERDPVRFGKLVERARLLQRMTLAGYHHEVVAEQRTKRQSGIELDNGPPADGEVERLVPHKRKQ